MKTQDASRDRWKMGRNLVEDGECGFPEYFESGTTSNDWKSCSWIQEQT